MRHVTSAFVAVGLASIGASAQGEGGVVTVAVENVRSEAGRVVANLCDDPAAVFCATYRTSAEAVVGRTDLRFEGVAPGRYAVVAFHDENGDGQPQIPPEGYAFGNGASFPPAFEAASIVVEGDTATSIAMAYLAGVQAGPTRGGSQGAPPPEGVARIDLRENGLYGELYLPEGASGPLPALILLGGSEGGLDVMSAMATSFAQEGYAALALAYWAEQGLPQTLENIPLEYFEAAVAWLDARPETGSIGVLGWSRGSEAALLLGARNAKVRAVAAVAPSGVVWRGIDFADMTNAGPAWTAGGEPLPYLKPDDAAYRPDAPMAPIFTSALADAPPETEIPVERIGGPILLVSGTDDALFPSADLAERIVARLEREGFAHPVENLVYPGAGHAVFVGAPDGMMARTMGTPSPMMGGTAEANAAAWADNWPRALAFFGAALKEDR